VVGVLESRAAGHAVWPAAFSVSGWGTERGGFEPPIGLLTL
jgi:hypothetical protein